MILYNHFKNCTILYNHFKNCMILYNHFKNCMILYNHFKNQNLCVEYTPSKDVVYTNITGFIQNKCNWKKKYFPNKIITDQV